MIDVGGSTPVSTSKGNGGSGGAEAFDHTIKISGASTEDTSGSCDTSGSGPGDGSSSINQGLDAVKATNLHPNTAELLATQRAHGGVSLWSYYESIDVLERQSAFGDAGIC